QGGGDTEQEMETTEQGGGDTEKEMETTEQESGDTEQEIDTTEQGGGDTEKEMETTEQESGDTEQEIDTTEQGGGDTEKEMETTEQGGGDQVQDMETTEQGGGENEQETTEQGSETPVDNTPVDQGGGDQTPVEQTGGEMPTEGEMPVSFSSSQSVLMQITAVPEYRTASASIQLPAEQSGSLSPIATAAGVDPVTTGGISQSSLSGDAGVGMNVDFPANNDPATNYSMTVSRDSGSGPETFTSLSAAASEVTRYDEASLATGFPDEIATAVSVLHLSVFDLVSYQDSDGGGVFFAQDTTGTGEARKHVSWGLWSFRPPDETIAATKPLSIGAFATGNQPYAPSNLETLTGTANFAGSGMGLYVKDGATNAFVGDALLTADFSNNQSRGTVSGTVDNIFYGSSDGAVTKSPLSITLGIAGITSTGAFAGNTSTADMTGKWAGRFYGPAAGVTLPAPEAAAGTFGASSTDGSHSLIGAFRADRNGSGIGDAIAAALANSRAADATPPEQGGTPEEENTTEEVETTPPYLSVLAANPSLRTVIGGAAKLRPTSITSTAGTQRIAGFNQASITSFALPSLTFPAGIAPATNYGLTINRQVRYNTERFTSIDAAAQAVTRHDVGSLRAAYPANTGRALGALSGTVDELISYESDDGIGTLFAVDTTGTGADRKYVIWGLWSFIPPNPTVAATKPLSIGVFASGNEAYGNSTLAALTGTARYGGGALGLYTKAGKTSVLMGDASLMAEFGDSSARGTLGGTIGNIYLGAADGTLTQSDLTVNLASTSIARGGSAAGLTSVTGAAGLSGRWSSYLYGPDTGNPSSIAGTFGASNGDNSHSLLGSFKADPDGRGFSIPIDVATRDTFLRLQNKLVHTNAIDALGVAAIAMPVIGYNKNDSGVTQSSFLGIDMGDRASIYVEYDGLGQLTSPSSYELRIDGVTILDSENATDLTVDHGLSSISDVAHSLTSLVNKDTGTSALIATAYTNAVDHYTNTPYYNTHISWGIWNVEPGTPYSTSSDFSYGAFVDSDLLFINASLKGITGKGEYKGSALGQYIEGGTRKTFTGETLLTADFGNNSEMGTIGGSISKINFRNSDDGSATASNLTINLETTSIMATSDGDAVVPRDGGSFRGFAHTVDSTIPASPVIRGMTGTWGGQFYGALKGVADRPEAVAGTFGARTEDGSRALIGAFKAGENSHGVQTKIGKTGR
ncbi:MAG: hypothetical protein V6Z81_07580, partial [Parvularculales bacterium]